MRLARANVKRGITPARARAELHAAHVAVFGRAPSAARLDVLVAHVRLEGLALPGRNLGGIDALRGQRRVGRLRAFASYREAARAYLRHLGRRCPVALAVFDRRDGDAAARALRGCSYFGAPVETYGCGLSAILAERRR